MKIISERRYVETTEYFLEFKVKGDKSSFRYAFPCDDKGNVKTLKPAGQENYDRCLKGFDERSGETLVRVGIDQRDHGYWESAVGLCQCGKKVDLHGFTNTCECGTDYNSSGQMLADRSQWGEETGEHWSECY